ncbi:hypothetical protein BJV78DRAFT_157028 [Lactifluus subvellereus]|nr:hypothetical protein BJV78DRAFT_157028 [Lactifluus subvellereus]
MDVRETHPALPRHQRTSRTTVERIPNSNSMRRTGSFGILSAHRAAYPEKFPLSEDVKEIYPLLGNVKDKMRSTAVHIQIYDDAAHILPLLFPFTTPGKFCIRAIAAFVGQVTSAPSSRLVIPMTPAISTPSTSSLASLDSSTLVFPRSNTLVSKPADSRFYITCHSKSQRPKRSNFPIWEGDLKFTEWLAQW